MIFVFIWTFCKEMGSIKIKGDNNQVYSDIKDSRINSDDNIHTINNDTITNNNSSKRWIGVASLIVAIIGLIITCIVYRDSIIQFFK